MLGLHAVLGHSVFVCVRYVYTHILEIKIILAKHTLYHRATPPAPGPFVTTRGTEVTIIIITLLVSP